MLPILQLTLLSPELDMASTETFTVPCHSEKSYHKDLKHSRLSEEELLVAHTILVPSAEEYRLQPIDQTLFLS